MRRCSPPSPPPDRWSRRPRRATRVAVASAWDALCAASATADAEAVGEEFQALFVGVGRSEVSLYASHYLGPQSGRPLAEIRATLGGLGLARKAESSEFEDHLSVVLETMRLLVSGDGDAAAGRHRRAARFLRAASDVVGLRLLHCNKRIVLLPITIATSHHSQVASWRSNVTRSPWNEEHQSHAVRWRQACGFPCVIPIPPHPARTRLPPVPPIRNAAASCSRWASEARAPRCAPPRRFPPSPR